MVRMVWDGRDFESKPRPDLINLHSGHVDAALELAELTHMGPFGRRTLEVGDYLGIFDGPRLISMAGERFYSEPFREISGVCTHPDYQGQGFAKRLVVELLRRQLARDEIPFLHVMAENTVAREFYRRLGFRDYQDIPLRVISKAEQCSDLRQVD